MNAKATRLLKEARALAWPWCAVTIASLLPLVEPSRSTERISEIALMLGIPLLAAVSFGAEFQHRTLPLLLTQPVNRMEIWAEKLSVTAVAVLSATLIFLLGGLGPVFPVDELGWVVGGAWIIAVVASAPVCTLFTRSTVGGFVLSLGVPNCIILGWLYLSRWMREAGYLSPANTGVSFAAFALLGCAVGMLWLGRRTLARLQVKGGMAGDDLLMAGADAMPESFAGWFRCRPTGAVLNLIRKELRLLRPLWLISLLAVLGWTCVTLLEWVPERGSMRPPTAAVVIMSMFSLLIPILAGSLSLGEERASGTHAWHLTLPVSARRQWLIKLLVALFAGSVCAALLPLLVLTAGGFLLGSPFRFVGPDAVMVWLLTMSLLTLASFWCACSANGTVRAVLLLFPMMGALGLAAGFGDWFARGLVGLLASQLDAFADFTFTNAVANLEWQGRGEGPTLAAAPVWVPTLLFAVLQSYRLFRAHFEDSTRSVLRNLLPLAVVASLCSFSLGAFDALVGNARQQMWTLFRETHEAIERVQPGTPKLDAAHPLQLTAEDLAKASPLSERARRWLANSRITVAPDQPHPHPPRPYCCARNSRSITFVPDRDYSWYLATIHLPGGSSCTLSFAAGRGYGILGGVCR